jgi:hypothetical protein
LDNEESVQEKISKLKDIFIEKEDTSNAAESARPGENIKSIDPFNKTPIRG